MLRMGFSSVPSVSRRFRPPKHVLQGVVGGHDGPRCHLLVRSLVNVPPLPGNHWIAGSFRGAHSRGDIALYGKVNLQDFSRLVPATLGCGDRECAREIRPTHKYRRYLRPVSSTTSFSFLGVVSVKVLSLSRDC